MIKYACKPVYEDGEVAGYKVGPPFDGHGIRGAVVLYGADYWIHRKASFDDGEWVVVEDVEAKEKAEKEAAAKEAVREILEGLDPETLNQIIKSSKEAKQ